MDVSGGILASDLELPVSRQLSVLTGNILFASVHHVFSLRDIGDLYSSVQCRDIVLGIFTRMMVLEDNVGSNTPNLRGRRTTLSGGPRT